MAVSPSRWCVCVCVSGSNRSTFHLSPVKLLSLYLSIYPNGKKKKKGCRDLQAKTMTIPTLPAACGSSDGYSYRSPSFFRRRDHQIFCRSFRPVPVGDGGRGGGGASGASPACGFSGAFTNWAALTQNLTPTTSDGDSLSQGHEVCSTVPNQPMQPRHACTLFLYIDVCNATT